jgi:hypothetical protein
MILPLEYSDEVTGGGWVKLHNKELHSLYSSPNIIRVIKLSTMRCAGHVARLTEKRKAFRILVGKPQGKRPNRNTDVGLNNIKMDLSEIGWAGSGFGPVESSCEHGNKPSVS